MNRLFVAHETVSSPMRNGRQFSRRQFTAAASTGIASALTGCSAGVFGQSNTVGPPTLTVSSWGEGVERKIVEKILDNYDQGHQNVNVAYQSIPNGQYSQTLKTRYAGDTEPDVFYMATERALQYMESDAVLDLTPYLEDDPNYAVDDLLDNLISAFQHEGKTYGIPKDFTSIGMYYNAAHLKQAGVGIPKTWDDLRSVFEAVKRKTDVKYPFGFYDQPGNTLYPLILQNGGAVLNEDETRCVVGSTEAVEALEFLVGIHDDGLGGRYSNEISASWLAPSMGEGLSTAGMAGAWCIPTFEEEYSGTFKSIDMFDPTPTPQGGEQATTLLTVAWAASATPTNEQAAAQLVKALTSKQGMWDWSKTKIALPSRQSLLDKPFYNDQPILRKLASFTDGGKPFRFGLHHERLHNTIMSEVEGALAGVKSADSALKSAERLVNNNVLE